MGGWRIWTICFTVLGLFFTPIEITIFQTYSVSPLSCWVHFISLLTICNCTIKALGYLYFHIFPPRRWWLKIWWRNGWSQLPLSFVKDNKSFICDRFWFLEVHHSLKSCMIRLKIFSVVTGELSNIIDFTVSYVLEIARKYHINAFLWSQNPNPAYGLTKFVLASFNILKATEPGRNLQKLFDLLFGESSGQKVVRIGLQYA